jgi:hypothetical protein
MFILVHATVCSEKIPAASKTVVVAERLFVFGVSSWEKILISHFFLSYSYKVVYNVSMY